MRRRAIFLASTDPYWNLAVEEHLFNTFDENAKVLLLYINSPAVVIGKHQNPWLEVHLSELQSRGVDLARRISGGGAVYHDRGNLNFSFLGSKDSFNRKRNLEFVQRVLRSIDIQADITDTADLYLGPKKISGNAFCFRRNRALHHGTLLTDADLSRLQGLLSPQKLPIKTHAVASKPAATVNLAKVYPHISCETLVSVLASAHLESAGEPETLYPADLCLKDVQNLAERNRSWEWIFGRTPDFELSVDEVTVKVRKGRIQSIEGELPPAFEPEPLIGTAFRKDDLSALFGRLTGDVESLAKKLHSLTL